MKKTLLLYFIFFAITSHSQIVFEKGYFIDNGDKKTECLIKNLDWRNNPKEFEYKLDQQDQSQKNSIDQVKEFGIYNVSKYQRQVVNIDRSKSILSDLDNDKNPKFSEEKLFLKVLIEGKASLYQYEEEDLIRFFFKVDNTPITQLVFKTYKVSELEVADNNLFRNQLYTALKSENLTEQNFKYINYKKAELIKVFTKYNESNNSQSVNFETKEKKDLFNLTVRPGIKSSSLLVKNDLMPNYNTDYGSKIGFRLGLEAEIILPFNKNKWAIIFEPTYQSFKDEKVQDGITSKIDYSSIEMPIGIRHYFFLNNRSKIFINAQYLVDVTLNNKTSFKNDVSPAHNLKINAGGTCAFGLGYNYNKKYSAEFRMGLAKNLLNKYSVWYSEYPTISLIFGYTIL